MRKFLTVIILMMFASNLFGAEIATRLPEKKTVVYLEFNVKQIIELAEKTMGFVDQECTDNIVFQLKELRKQLKELASIQKFNAKIIDHANELKGYLVVMTLPEPIVTTHTYKSPKWDRKTGKRIEGEFEEHSYTSKTEFSTGFVVETTEELATDFMTNLKAAAVYAHEKVGKDGSAYKEVEVDGGEGIMQGKHTFIGRRGNLIIFSDAQYKEIWNELMEPAEKSIASSTLYRRYTQGNQKPMMTLLVNIAGFVEKLETSLRNNVKEQREAAKKKAEEGENDQMNRGNYMLTWAESSLKQFLVVKNLFSLDKMKNFGVTANATVSDNRINSSSTLTLSLDDGIGPVLNLILDGGKSLQAPNIGKHEGVALMARVGTQKMLDAIREALGENVDSLNQTEMKAQMMLGSSLNDIITQLSGDLYLLCNLVEKNHEVTNWNRETNKMETKTKFGPMPEFLMLFGLNDSEAFSQMLSKFFTAFSVNPNVGRFIKKRTYQENDVYIVGADAGKEDADPDGLYNYAMVVIGRHLSFGSWKDMTALIRLAKTAQTGEKNHLTDAIAKHSDANFLCVVPKPFIEKLQKIMKDDNQGDMFEEALKNIDEIPIPEEYQDLGGRMRDTVKKLIESASPLYKKMQNQGAKTIILHGKKTGNFYELKTKDEIVKQ